MATLNSYYFYKVYLLFVVALLISEHWNTSAKVCHYATCMHCSTYSTVNALRMLYWTRARSGFYQRS